MNAPATSNARRRRELAAIHAAKRDLGLDAETYRDLVERLTGERSAAVLDAAGRAVVLDYFASQGWRPTRSGQRSGRNPDRATIKANQARLAARRATGAGGQEALILSLWDALEAAGAFRTAHPRLETLMERVLGRPVSHPRFLAPHEAGKVIEALKAWLRRARRSTTRDRSR